jgi:hypothetical protein
MSKQIHQLLQSKPIITVATRTQHNAENLVWFVSLAAFAAGVFYYYFWGATGSVLIGN